MSRGEAPPSSAQPQDVWTSPQLSSSAMPQPSAPTHTLTQPLSDHHNNNHSSSDLLTNSSGLHNNSNNSNNYNNNSFNHTAADRGTYLNRYLNLNLTTSGPTTEDYSRLQAQFYQSYDPQIGLHTAAVLGGILGWLIVYLLYKTKVKKWVLGFVRRKYKKRKQRRKAKKKREAFGEFHQENDLNSDPAHHSSSQRSSLKNAHPQKPKLETDHKLNSQKQGDLKSSTDQSHPDLIIPDTSMGKQQCPMPSIVVESYSSLPQSGHNVSKPQAQGQSRIPQAITADSKVHVHSHKSRKKSGKQEKERGGREKRKRYRKKKGRSQGQQCPEVTVLDVDELDTKSLLLPPCSQADSAQATARWVQTMPLLMQSHQDVTGLILKIRPNMVGSKKQQSCPLISAALQYAALPLLGLPNVGLNNSMPHLADNGLGSLKNSKDLLFCDEKSDLGLNNGVELLQPLPYSAPASRPQSSQSHIGPPAPVPPRIPPRTPPVPVTTPPIPARTPPRLTISIPEQGQFSASSSNLAVPGGGLTMTSCSAPTSPVPIPVTPTVTIQKFTSRVSRGLSRSLQQQQHHDSQDSVSSSSSLDPLLQLQHDCECPSLQPQPPLSPHPPPPPPPLHHSPVPPPPLQPQAKTSPRSSWTVFDDDGGRYSCGGGGGGNGGGGSPNGSGACSRHTSDRPNLDSSSAKRSCSEGQDATQGKARVQDTVFTLETKL